MATSLLKNTIRNLDQPSKVLTTKCGIARRRLGGRSKESCPGPPYARRCLPIGMSDQESCRTSRQESLGDYFSPRTILKNNELLLRPLPDADQRAWPSIAHLPETWSRSDLVPDSCLPQFGPPHNGHRTIGMQ